MVPTLSEEQQKALSELIVLPLAAFLEALPNCQAHIKQSLPLALLHPLYDKLDEALEHQSALPLVLQSLLSLIQIKSNRSLFRSLDRLLVLLKESDDLQIIRYALNIIICFFKSREIP